MNNPLNFRHLALLCALLLSVSCSEDDPGNAPNNANNSNNVNNTNGSNNANNSNNSNNGDSNNSNNTSNNSNNNSNNSNNNSNSNNSNTSNNSNNADDMGVDMTDMGSDMTPSFRGECGVDADCPDRRTCRLLPNTPGGYGVCLTTIEDPPSPCEIDNMGTLGNECCTSRGDCTDSPMGQCTFGPIFYCGGAAPAERNVCVYGECTDESDCGRRLGGVCVPAGAFNEPASVCVYGGCLADGDCTEGTNGSCDPFFNPCSNRFIGFHCTYDESECRRDADCTRSGIGTPYCAPGTDGMPTCESFIPPP